jgi:membrane fusion protein (multidrug efflux system)
MVRGSGERVIAEGHVKRWVVLLGIGTGLMLMTACSSDRPPTVNAAAPAATAQPAPTAERSDVYLASGPLVVENQVDVAAQREGVVARILVDVGTRVRKGQLLARLDDRQLTADHEAAKAKADGMRADLQHWQAELKMREADLWRAEQMWKAQLITQQQLEHDRYSVQGGKYYLQRQEEDLKNTEAAERSAQLEVDKTRIVAPFDGVVARRYVREGQKVAANDRLFWVTATAPLNVRFTLPQEFVGRVKVGDTVQVAPAFDQGVKHSAKVTLVSPVVDPASGTIELQAQLVGAPGQLRPGMTVNINVKP